MVGAGGARDEHGSRLFPKLAEGDVHLWRARLARGERDHVEATRLLSVDELARAGRFHRSSDAREFVAARSILRRLLGGYLCRDPRDLRFAYDQNGKPRLTAEHAGTLCLSVTHSHGAALYGIARGREVGVDLEFVRTDLALLEIARRFFAPAEIFALSAAPAAERAATFYRCWTRKEAYLKARGWGLTMALDAFSVSPERVDGPVLLRDGLDSEDVRCWSLRDHHPFPGYAAAVAVEEDPRGSAARCELWDWDRTPSSRREALPAQAHVAAPPGPSPSS